MLHYLTLRSAQHTTLQNAAYIELPWTILNAYTTTTTVTHYTREDYNLYAWQHAVRYMALPTTKEYSLCPHHTASLLSTPYWIALPSTPYYTKHTTLYGLYHITLHYPHQKNELQSFKYTTHPTYLPSTCTFNYITLSGTVRNTDTRMATREGAIILGADSSQALIIVNNGVLPGRRKYSKWTRSAPVLTQSSLS